MNGPLSGKEPGTSIAGRGFVRNERFRTKKSTLISKEKRLKVYKNGREWSCSDRYCEGLGEVLTIFGEKIRPT